MKKLLPGLFLLASTSSFSQINVMWESRYNSTSNNVDRVSDMVVDASGNVYVTGSSLNAASGASGFDIVTIKYNSSGVQQWIQTFNGSGNGPDNAASIALDASGNVYVGGTSYRGGTDYDFCVIKYNNSGVQQWQIYNGAGTNYDELKAITLDASGQPIAVGGVQPTSTNTNYRTLKLNAATGAVTWNQDFTSTGSNLDIAVAVTTDASDNVYVTGHSFNSGEDLNVRTIKYNSAGTLQWNTQRNQNTTLDSYDMPSDIAVDATGITYVLATVFNGAASDDDIYLIKYNVAGTILTTVELNGTANAKDKPTGMKLDAAGNIYITGYLKGASTAEDLFIAKYNSSLAQQWIDKYNGSGNNYDEGDDISFDLSGTNLFVTGYSYLTTSNNDYVTLKYDLATGTRQWLTRFNGPANNADNARAIAIDGIGNIYVSGDSKGAGTNYDFSTIKYCQLKTVATVDDDTACVGSVFTLNVVAGGTSSVTWSPAATLSCPTCTTTLATPTTDVCYIVTTTDAAGCSDDDTVCVVINPLPGPVITPDGPTSFCVGDSVGLTASGFAAYSWNTGETSASITADTAGTYTVTVTDAQGCQNFTDVAVTVYSLPNIDAGLNQDHCAGDSSQFTATGGVSYVWDANADLTSTTVDNPYTTAYIAGTYWYYVTGTDGNGCKNRDSVNVTVYGLPVAPILFRPASSDLVFVTNYSSDLEWYMNGTYIPSAGSGSTLDLGDTSATWGCQAYVTNYFNAIYTDANGCVSPVSDTLVVDTIYNPNCYIGVQEVELFNVFNVYPNPFNANITIDLMPVTNGDFDLTIVDMAGKVVYAERWNNVVGLNRKTIDMTMLSSGIYQLNLRNTKGEFAGVRLVKE